MELGLELELDKQLRTRIRTRTTQTDYFELATFVSRAKGFSNVSMED